MLDTVQEQQLSPGKFDYSMVDNRTAEFLKGAAVKVTGIMEKTATEVGEQLFKARSS